MFSNGWFRPCFAAMVGCSDQIQRLPVIPQFHSKSSPRRHHPCPGHWLQRDRCLAQRHGWVYKNSRRKDDTHIKQYLESDPWNLNEWKYLSFCFCNSLLPGRQCWLQRTTNWKSTMRTTSSQSKYWLVIAFVDKSFWYTYLLHNSISSSWIPTRFIVTLKAWDSRKIVKTF